jgi:hypothetical protein
MFDWLRKAFGGAKRSHRRRHHAEEEFTHRNPPAKLPPIRSGQPPRAKQRPSWGLKAVPGALVASDKRTGQVVYNMLTPHMQQFMGRCIGAIKRNGVIAAGTGQFSIIVGEQRIELGLDRFYQPSDDPAAIDKVVAEARRIVNPASDTRANEGVFSVTLPGHWTRLPPSDGARWTYRSEREQLTVSLMSSTHRMSDDEQISTIERVTELRRRAETETLGIAGVTMTETTFAESGGVHAARFGGVESASQRRFHCLLLCSSCSVTVFYYEAIGMTQQEADSRARPIFNSVAVA